jgi:outer membrane lipoprotein SlyB
MRYTLLTTLALLILCGCSSPPKNPYGTNGTFGMMNNGREFGTVFSTSMGSGVATKSTMEQGSSGGWFSSSNEPDQVSIIHYVINKDNGNRTNINQVPEEGEAICYPGQRVMIQDNGGYLRVYPLNIEHSRNDQ